MRTTIRVAALALAIASFALTSLAQNSKAELALGYSYLSQNTKLSFDSPSGFAHSFLGGIHGGDAGLTFNLNNTVGLKLDVAGYRQSPSETRLFTMAAGPVIKKHSGKFNPFAQALFGFAHRNVSGFNLLGCVNRLSGCAFDTGQWAFAGIAGGGIDIKLSEYLSLRPVEVDYVLTTFGSDNANGFNLATRQNNVRAVAGLVFAF